jgi:hypothetical protein
MVEIGSGRATTADLVQELRVRLPNASAGDKAPIMRLLAHLEGEDPVRGRPRVPDDDVIAEARASIARGTLRRVAIAVAVRELRKRESTDPESIARRVRGRLLNE